MSTIKISQLPSITGANTAGTDLIPLVDVSLNVTNKITRSEFFTNVPPLSVTGNITVTGTVDGRDISVDGTKLDGIEAGAEVNPTAAEIKTLYESNPNTNAFTDAEKSKLAGIEAGADVTDTANVTAAGALMDSELTNIAAVKALNQGVSTTDSPSFVSITTLSADLGSVDAIDISLNGTLVTATASELNVLDGITATTAELNILDGVTATAAEINVLDGLVTSTAELNYVDGVTSPIQTQLDNRVVRTSSTGSAVVPSGTTAQRDASAFAGYFRFNADLGKFEGYNGTVWGSVGGGATGGGSDAVFIENDQVVTTNYTITSGKNAMTTGPITVNSGVTVTVPSGSNWVVL